MSLNKYLEDNKIDQIADDQEFMEAEYDTIRTYCEICGYSISDEDLEVIMSRGLDGSFIVGGNIMSRYGISVREISKRTVIVEADNIAEAIQKVEEAVEREEIILDVDDYDDREIVPSEYWNGGKVPEGEDVSYYWHIGEDK